MLNRNSLKYTCLYFVYKTVDFFMDMNIYIYKTVDF